MAAPRKVIKKRKDLKRIEKGCAHIHASFNNTIVPSPTPKAMPSVGAARASLALKAAVRAPRTQRK